MATVRWGWLLAIIAVLILEAGCAAWILARFIPPPDCYVLGALAGSLIGCGGVLYTKPWWLG